MPLFPHKRLARHAGVWRVDGIGPIEDKGGQLGLRAVVHFSLLTDVGVRDPYSKNASTENPLRLPVHSASLHHFRAGSLWREGKRIFGCQPIPRSFRIDAGRMFLVELNKEVNLNGLRAPTIVPGNYLNFGKANRDHLASTLYAVVPVLSDPKTQWLIVPATELVRFYTGVSSRFMSGALKGRLDNYIDWAASRVENGIPIIRTQQRLSRKEAMVLARAVASAQAKTALLGVHQNLAAVHANNTSAQDSDKRPLIIKAFFPFNDTTELQIAGKKMLLAREGSREQWGIFAMELLTCSHHPGFDGFVVEGGDPLVIRTPGDRSGSGKPPPTYDPDFEDEEDNSEVDEVPADLRLPRLIIRTYTDQFIGFRGLRIEHRRPSVERPEGESRPHIDVPVKTLTIEDGSQAEEAKGNLGVSESQSKIEHVDRGLTLFLDMIKLLRNTTKSKGWTVSTRKLDDGLPRDGEWIALFPTDLAKRRSWHLIGESNVNRRPRQVAWVEVSKEGTDQYFNLLEMELKPQETSTQCTILMYVKDFTSLDDKLFREWLVLTAIQNRWPALHNKWLDLGYAQRAQDFFSKVNTYRIQHPHRPRIKAEDGSADIKIPVSPGAWSERLIEEISKLIPQF